MEIYAPVKSKAKESIMEEITPKSLKNELKIFEIIDNRNFDCNYYTKCLNYAAGLKRHYRGFVLLLVLHNDGFDWHQSTNFACKIIKIIKPVWPVIF